VCRASPAARPTTPHRRVLSGPEDDAPEHLERLRERGLGAKRSPGPRAPALGVAAPERCGRRAPLRRVHERVFGVPALEGGRARREAVAARDARPW
jgi:hypothetical protein